MTTATTILHVYEREPAEIEAALNEIFTGEERPQVMRLEGTYSAVLARLLAADLDASYRYLALRPRAPSRWVPLLELGNRTEGLNVELSRALRGAVVFTIFVYGEIVSGYRVVRDGHEVDRYLSDPSAFATLLEAEQPVRPPPETEDDERGHPERFADLLPAGTAADDFARVVLHPGWWEEHADSSAKDEPARETIPSGEADDADAVDEDEVDEVDRARCIGLALELWEPAEYPWTGELEDIPNRVAGPALALAYR